MYSSSSFFSSFFVIASNWYLASYLYGRRGSFPPTVSEFHQSILYTLYIAHPSHHHHHPPGRWETTCLFHPIKRCDTPILKEDVVVVCASSRWN